MFNNNDAKKPTSKDLLEFLINYENADGLIQHPVEKLKYEKKLAEEYEYAEWTGAVIRIEDISDLGSGPEEYYIDVIVKDNPRTPKNNFAGFTAYFNHIDKDDLAKVKIDGEITIRGKIDKRNKFLGRWILKESKII